jgi:hypothetical protein
MSYSDQGVTSRPAGDGRVVITGVQMPFGDMVMLIIKIVLASIPAYIILFIIFLILGTIFGGMFAALIGGGGGGEFSM